jgi:DNA polymerase III subunit alpha
MSKDFTHLHVHSDYSQLDGINKVDKLCARVKELGMSSIALTDHGVLHGIVEFYKAAKAAGVKPIIGVEAYITDDPDNLEDTDQKRTRDNYHMIILAKNNIGLKNLFWLVSNANINNFYYKPRISFKHFETRSEGLIVTSSCLGGWVAGHGEFEAMSGGHDGWKPGNDNRPLHALNRAKEIFGKNFYLEVQDNDLLAQNMYNQWLIETAKKENVQLTVSCDAHYLTQDDYEVHQMIMAQQLKKTIDEYRGVGCEEKEALVYSPKLYIRSPDDIYDVCHKLGIESAAENTLAISEQCNVELSLGKYQIPTFDITKTSDYGEFLQWQTQQSKLKTLSH